MEPIIFGFENLPQSSFKAIGGNVDGFYVESFYFLADKLHCFVSIKEDCDMAVIVLSMIKKK